MRTPWGFECRYFFGDYYRGRNREECRLLVDRSNTGKWDSRLCKTCPVPGILRANACPNLVIFARVDSLFLGIQRKMKITATCSLSGKMVAEPYIGCGKCHTIDLNLGGESNESDGSA